MNQDPYQLQTDRDAQWALWEARMKKHGTTRKNLRLCKRYFFDGVDESGQFRVRDKFLMYPEPGFAGWQRLLDEELNGQVTDEDYRGLNLLFCGDLADYFFCIEDQDYYFKAVFGERYDPARCFPLRINGEDERRRIVVGPNVVFSALMLGMSRYVKATSVQHPYSGLARFNEGYVESLIGFIDKKSFEDKQYRPLDMTEDGEASMQRIQETLMGVLRFSLATASNDEEKDRVTAAQRITDLLMDHADDLADLRVFYERAKKSPGVWK